MLTPSFGFQASVETEGRLCRGQMILEKRLMADGRNADADVNVEVVEEIDVELTQQLLIRGMTGSQEWS